METVPLSADIWAAARAAEKIASSAMMTGLMSIPRTSFDSRLGIVFNSVARGEKYLAVLMVAPIGRGVLRLRELIRKERERTRSAQDDISC